MVTFTKTSRDITQYKPKMKAFYIKEPSELKTIPVAYGKTTLQEKGDGEFSLIHIDRNEIYAVNRFGRETRDLPALRELHMLFHKSRLEEAELLAEIYAMDGDKPLPLPKLVHYLKGGNKNLQRDIHIGLFDFVYITAERYTDDISTTIRSETFNSSIPKFEMLRKFNGKLCGVLEWTVPQKLKDVEQFWTQKVEKEHWEGLVIRTNGDTYKAKPNKDIDAVIIGINKNTKGYEKGLAKSVKVALMPDEGSFVEIGDATVPSDAEATALFELTHVKTNETNATTFVKPLIVVQIDYISLFPDTTNTVYKLYLGGFMEHGTMKAVRMKSPRVKGYRRDKHACTSDVGLNQIGSE